MKKRLISICLALLFALAPASAAFSDIADSSLSQKVSILDALGIMQGMGDDRFNPDGSLTRAQFCKIAVTAMGITDVSAYASYTIFPDVKHAHWAAGYINAAVRHPDLKDLAIIRGYADGTFGPERTVNYGEVCTMLLRMLGYAEADVGPFWPADYIAKAQALGLTEGVSVSDAKAAVRRADAAVMLLNALTAPRKDGGEATLMDNLVSGTVDDCILLATSATDSSLASNEALFYEDGAVTGPRRTAGTLDSSMIGVYGTMVLKDNAVVGMIPAQNRTETYTVTSVTAGGIQTGSQTIHPGSGDRVFVTRAGYSVGTFGALWSSIWPGDTLHIYYDAFGAPVLMAVFTGSSPTVSSSFVYGVDSAAQIPQGDAVVKNGVTVTSGQLAAYDVVMLDSANRQALVSDAKLSGQYTAAAPDAQNPSSVTVCGQTFAVSGRAAASFASLHLKDYITLLFNADGEVVAAYPKTTVNADMLGRVTDVSGSRVSVRLFNGLTLRDLQVDASDMSSLLGCAVTVGQSANGAIFLTRAPLPEKVQGDWSVAEQLLGSAAVSDSVQLYTQAEESAALQEADAADLPAAVVPAEDIVSTVLDSSGSVIAIVLRASAVNG